MPARHLELAALDLQLMKEPSMVDRGRRLARERLHQGDDARGEGSRPAAADDERAEDLGLAHEGYRKHREPTRTEQLRQMSVQVRVADVRDRERPAGRGCLPHERVVQTDPGGPERVEQLFARAERGADRELLRLRVELEDGAAFGPGQLHGLGNDGRKHLVQIEARIDGVADLVQSLQLLDRVSELAAPQVQLLHQVGVADRDRTLGGERQGDVHLASRKGVYPLAPERDDSDHVAVAEHRHAADGAEPPEALGLGPFVIRVDKDVVEEHRAPFESDSPHERPLPRRNLASTEQ